MTQVEKFAIAMSFAAADILYHKLVTNEQENEENSRGGGHETLHDRLAIMFFMAFFTWIVYQACPSLTMFSLLLIAAHMAKLYRSKEPALKIGIKLLLQVVASQLSSDVYRRISKAWNQKQQVDSAFQNAIQLLMVSASTFSLALASQFKNAKGSNMQMMIYDMLRGAKDTFEPAGTMFNDALAGMAAMLPFGAVSAQQEQVPLDGARVQGWRV
jgi:hypothetical protein